MKRTLILILAAFMLMAAAGCSRSDEMKPPQSVETVTNAPTQNDAEPTKAAEPDARETEAPDEPVETEAPDEPTEAPSGKVTVEEQVLVDEKDVKITLKTLDNSSWFGPELKILIENNSDKNLLFSIENACVNGYMNNASLYASVSAGKKANEEISLSQTDIEACGITTIACVEVCFDISDEEYDDYLNTDLITIKTSADEGYDYTFNDSGEVAYDEGGVKIVVKGLADNNLFGAGVVFYIENNSDTDVLITSDNVSVNGFMVDDLLYCTVLAGRHAVDTSTLMSSDIEENGIETIEEIEMIFQISEADTWKTIAESDPVKFAF